MNVTTKIKGAKMFIYVPFNKDFVNRIHSIGSAKWNRESRCWIANTDAKEDVDEILQDVFGTTGDTPTEVCTITIKALDEVIGERDSVYFCGIPLARATSRDSGAKIASRNVDLIKGIIDSGGSIKNWETCIIKGSIFKVHQFNMGLLDKAKQDDRFEITDVNKNSDLDRLKKRKKQLEDELANINKLIASSKKY